MIARAAAPVAALAGLALVAAALIAGCAAVPMVDYHRLGPGAHHDDWVPFRLTDSIVVIGAPAAKADDAAVPPVDLARATVRCPKGVCGAVAIAAVPTDFRGATYAIEPRRRRLIGTTAAPTYFANSLRLKTLTIEAKDHRLEAINAVAALAGGAARLAGGDLSNADPTDDTATLALPVALPPADLRCADAGCPTTAPLPGNPAWTYAVTRLDDPAAAGMLPRAALDTVHGAMVASACRRVRLTLHHAAKDVTVVLDTDIADPDWLLTVPFPAKGALTFHSLCGVDVQPQAVTEIGVDAMATAFVNGVEQVARRK